MSIILENINVKLKLTIEKNKDMLYCKYMAINSKEITCLLGDSGSGKSLLIDLILGNLDDKVFLISGTITYKTNKINKVFTNYIEYVEFVSLLKQKYSYFGYISQYVNQMFTYLDKAKLFDDLTVKEITLIEFFSIWVFNTILINDDIKNAFQKILSDFNIVLKQDILKITQDELSLGEKQRFNIALVLSKHPTILIGDEITSSLDIENSLKITNLLNNFIIEKEIYFLWVTHDLILAKKKANKIYFIENKSIVLKNKNDL